MTSHSQYCYNQNTQSEAKNPNTNCFKQLFPVSVIGALQHRFRAKVQFKSPNTVVFLHLKSKELIGDTSEGGSLLVLFPLFSCRM